MAAVAVVLALGIRLLPLALSYGVSPEPWDAATQAVLSAARPGDCVVFYPEDGHNPFQYYERPMHGSVAALGAAGDAMVAGPLLRRALRDRRRALHGCRRLWLVSSHEGQSHGPARSRRNLRHFNHFRTALEHQFGSGPVKTYGYASAIHVRLLPGRQ